MVVFDFKIFSSFPFCEVLSDFVAGTTFFRAWNHCGGLEGKDKCEARGRRRNPQISEGTRKSAEGTGREQATVHRYLQQQMFKVFIGFMRKLAHNYRKEYYDDRNEWASRVAAEAYGTLVRKRLVYDPEFEEIEELDNPKNIQL